MKRLLIGLFLILGLAGYAAYIAQPGSGSSGSGSQSLAQTLAIGNSTGQFDIDVAITNAAAQASFSPSRKIWFHSFNGQATEQVIALYLSNAVLTVGDDSGPQGKVVTNATGVVSCPGYLQYVALLIQTGTNAPVATVLQNTLGGTPVWTRDNQGLYTATLSGAFPTAKTVVFCTPTPNDADGLAFFGATISANACHFNVTLGGSPSDGILNNSSVEIRVYP